MGMEDFRFLLHDLAVAFRENAANAGAWWNGRLVPGRFYIDPFEVPLNPIEPGVGVTQIRFYCDRAECPKPWPEVGDHLTIRGQIYEIVERGEDDLGEFAFRMIRQQIGISTVTSEGVYAASPRSDFSRPDIVAASGLEEAYNGGRPSRRVLVARAFVQAMRAGAIDPTQPVHEILPVIRERIGNGQGLSDRTLRRFLAVLRARARP